MLPEPVSVRFNELTRSSISKDVAEVMFGPYATRSVAALETVSSEPYPSV